MTAETAGERAAILHDDELHQHVPPSALPNDGVRNSGDIGIDLAPPAGPRFADKFHGHEGPVRVPFRHENIFHPHIGIGQSVVIPSKELLKLLHGTTVRDIRRQEPAYCRSVVFPGSYEPIVEQLHSRLLDLSGGLGVEGEGWATTAAGDGEG